MLCENNRLSDFVSKCSFRQTSMTAFLRRDVKTEEFVLIWSTAFHVSVPLVLPDQRAR